MITAVICTIGELYIEFTIEARNRDLPFDCVLFPLHPNFTESSGTCLIIYCIDQSRHRLPNHNVHQDTAPNGFESEVISFFLKFGLLSATQWDIKKQSHRVKDN